MTRIQELHSLAGKVSLVTGGAGHVGRAVCRTLGELGSHIAVADFETAAESAQRALGAELPVEVAAFDVDFEREDLTRGLATRVVDRFGRLDVLVHCAALVSAQPLPGWTTSFDAQQAETWRRAIEVNLTAPFLLTQAAAAALRATHGCVIAVGSIYGMLGPDLRLYEGTGMGNAAGYAASKGGLAQLVRWLATVLAPDVRVNLITLGGVARGQPRLFQDRYVARTPLGRMGREDDIRGAIAYLASDASAYTTGQNLVIDGGFSAW